MENNKINSYKSFGANRKSYVIETVTGFGVMEAPYVPGDFVFDSDDEEEVIKVCDGLNKAIKLAYPDTSWRPIHFKKYVNTDTPAGAKLAQDFKDRFDNMMIGIEGNPNYVVYENNDGQRLYINYNKLLDDNKWSTGEDGKPLKPAMTSFSFITLDDPFANDDKEIVDEKDSLVVKRDKWKYAGNVNPMPPINVLDATPVKPINIIKEGFLGDYVHNPADECEPDHNAIKDSRPGETFSVGDKVVYIATNEIGIVKAIGKAFNADNSYVVFKCGGDWENYDEYTSALCKNEFITKVTDEYFETRINVDREH